MTGATPTVEQVDRLYSLFTTFLDSSTPAEAVKALQMFQADEALVDAVRARHESESVRIIDMDEPPSVHLDGRPTWYAGPDLKRDKNWPALVRGLERKGFSPESIADIDEASTKIVALLDHPKQKTFRSRGLVVGFVQSGKTTSFTSVMAKAADRQYKLVIVLSGIHNALRRQTQVRLVADLVEYNPGLWHQVTSEDHDFVPPANAKAFFASKGQHVLLVVKKNAAVLRKLNTWLASAGEFLDDCPTLIIDDEADQSTVATKIINPLLQDLLGKFPKVGYVGYTATPFANLLIDPAATEDFYPRDFIVNLPKPTGYHGTEVLFGRELLDGEDPADLEGGYDMIREIPDDEVDELKPRSRADAATFSPTMTPALQDAVEWFWMATAARRARGHAEKHSTMLVHTTTYTGVHMDFADILRGQRNWMKAHLADDVVVDRLRRTWSNETERVSAGYFAERQVAFHEMYGHLAAVVAATTVVVDNYLSKDRLDYESGPVTAIAVGGNTLSRGLTLEGLVSSFFVRSVSAYDTLLQMGRWFGFRGGYADLPRIWMAQELGEWFRHLATVEEEIRRDINRYMTNPAETPETFAVRLRSHPKLAITAKAKMKAAVKASAAYGGTLIESRFYDVGADGAGVLAENAAAAEELLSRASANGTRETAPRDETVLFTGVPRQDVEAFLSRYAFHENSVEADRSRMLDYIGRRARAGALGQWSVAVIGNSAAGAGAARADLGSGVDLNMVKRGRLTPTTKETDAAETSVIPNPIADIKTLTSRRDELIDLTVESKASRSRGEIMKLRREQRPDQGLLLIYPIDPVSDTGTAGRSPLNAPAEVVIGVALVFPEPRPGTSDTEVEYWSADLSSMAVEEEDTTPVESNQDDVA